jgi:hypothetical protein
MTARGDRQGETRLRAVVRVVSDEFDGNRPKRMPVKTIGE